MKIDDDLKEKRRRLIKTFGFGLLFSSSLISAITVPIVSHNNKRLSLNLNHSTSSYEGNKNRISDFINNELSQSSYRLSGSLSIFGKTGIIGSDDVELTSTQRSLLTVVEAYENGLFKLQLKSTIAYSLKQNNINYKLSYVKPYYTDSSYPVVGITFYYGVGSTYYEEVFEYRDTSLYGFKKSIEQTMINSYVLDISKNPNLYFELNEEIGTIGQIGLYAKNIKTSDFNLNNNKLKELKKNNFWISITSIDVDEFNPSLLKLVYTITYDDGIVTNQSTGNQVHLGPFDIEQGVDDPKSKLKNFINSNEGWIDGLNQYFVYEKPEDDKNEYTVREAYEKGFIKFETTYSINSKLESEGIKLEFKTFEEEKEIIKTKKSELSVQNYKFDSTTPMYRLYFSSYSGTPLEYTESILIEGLAQENDFKVSQEEKDMKALNAYLGENNLGFENIFDFDFKSSTQPQNPLSLSDYFVGTENGTNKVTFENGKYSIPFYLVENLYNKYKDPSNKLSNEFPSPFTNFKFALKTANNVQLPSSYMYEGQSYNISSIANNALMAVNDPQNGDQDFQLDSISNNSQTGELSMKFNMYLGSATEGTIYVSVDFLEIYVSKYFESKQMYLETILDKIQLSPTTGGMHNTTVTVNTKVYNEEILKQYIRERKFSSIFDSVSIVNLGQEIIPFSELQPELKSEINFSYFYSLDKKALESAIESRKINIEIIISIDNVFVQKTVEKSFDELINK